MHALRMTLGEMVPGCAQLTLTPAPSGWQLKGVDFEGREQTTTVEAIDGILFADPLGEAGRAVIWRHDAEEQAAAQAGTAPQPLHVDAGSAACIVAQDIAAKNSPDQPLSGLFLVATRGGQEQQAQLEIAAGAWRVQNLKDLFFERLPVLYGDDRLAKLPDYPVPAEWVSAVQDVRIEPRFGQGGRPDRVTYHVKLRGLEGTLRRVYEAAELAALGDPDHNNLGWNFRLQVWPNVNLRGWRFYAVDVGLAYDADWTNQWHWGLFCHVEAQRENDPLPYRLAPCKPQALPARASKYATLHGLPGKRQRVVSQQRPNYIQIDCNLSGVRVGGVFNLLDHAPAISPAQGAVDLGIDIGTSNSCISVSTPTGEVFSLDFNQMNGEAWPGTDFGSLVFHKVGRPEQVRALKPWLPGVEGPLTAEAPAGHSPPVRQIPSLVVAMDDPDDETRLWDLTPANVANALPFLDVVIPPADFVNSYSSPIWVERSFSKLKWFGDDPLLPKAFLKKYIVMLYMFAATKLRRTNFTVKLSYPLSFTNTDRDYLKAAAEDAAREVSDYYADLSVNPQLYADESRCIVDKHVRTLPVHNLPIVVVCDIGGGSVDVAVATFKPDDAERHTMVFLGADSVRFGANLLFNRMSELLGNEAFPAPNTIDGDAKRFGYIVERMRRAVRADGYASILRRVGPGTRQLAKEYFQLYFLLVREFVARSVAGTIRNPYRLGGAMHRFRGGKGEPAGAEDLANQAGMPPKIMLYGVCTGNGWRCLEALAPDQAMNRDLPVVRDFSRALALRVKALVAEPIAGESPDLGGSFGGMQVPGVEMAIGLRRTNDEYVLKEALADAILSYVAHGTTKTAELSAPNGVNERFQSFDDVLVGSEGRVVPWYAYVGSERITWKSPENMADVEPPTGIYALGAALGVSGDVGPAMPADILAAGLKFNRSLEVKDMLIGQLNDLTSGVRYSTTGRRERPLLAVLYEVAYSQLFDKRWLHR